MKYALIVLTKDRLTSNALARLMEPFKTGGMAVAVDVTKDAEIAKSESVNPGQPMHEFLFEKGWIATSPESMASARLSHDNAVGGSMILGINRFGVEDKAYAKTHVVPVTHRAYRVGGEYERRMYGSDGIRCNMVRFRDLRHADCCSAARVDRIRWVATRGVSEADKEKTLSLARLRFNTMQAWRRQDEIRSYRKYLDKNHPEINTITRGVLSHVTNYSIPASWSLNDFYDMSKLECDAVMIHGKWADDFYCHPALKNEYNRFINGFSFKQGGIDMINSYARSNDWLTMVEITDPSDNYTLRKLHEHPRFEDI